MSDPANAERRRLAADKRRAKNWKRWGPYLSERQWGTVREDYSADGNCWAYFPFEDSHQRTYRWGEDGLLGICDRECRLCFALALWNEEDPILKERLYGLGGPQGNHGEDVKEAYFYLDNTPTHTYMKALYKYPQRAFPYEQLLKENERRGSDEPEFELDDTGAFEGSRYFDVLVEYAKGDTNDILIRLTLSNRGQEEAPLHVLPTLWFRNTWAWGSRELGDVRPCIRREGRRYFTADHPTLGSFRLWAGKGPDNRRPDLLLTENDTNGEMVFGIPNAHPWVKDAFHRYIVHGERDAVNPEGVGTKAAAHYRLTIPPGESVTLRLRLTQHGQGPKARPFGKPFDDVIAKRQHEADAFYDRLLPAGQSEEHRRIARQAYAGLLWNKQFYYYVVADWLRGDPQAPPPPHSHRYGRNSDWEHLHNRDVISMPDKWEYPWYAAWDLAFHMIPFARLDPDYAKRQLELLLREWYMHPNGQIPAYEFAFSDVNPPVHAWACWRVYKMTGRRGRRDRRFLARTFHKLLINFTWWVNRKDIHGKHLFSGGFLGLDNIGVFDRSQPLPTGGILEQADATAWMAFYCGTMLSIALELAAGDPAYEGVASKFFEHFVAITDSMNTLGGTGLWDEKDGFYYDQIRLEPENRSIPLRTRSLVGLIPLIAVEVLPDEELDRLPEFRKRMRWFLEHRRELARYITYKRGEEGARGRHLLALPSRERLVHVLKYMLDESEFLSPFGIRSLSRYHLEHPFVFEHQGVEHRVKYMPGESVSGMFGGNSNWRGPVWFPVNFLLIEALERYHHFYGDGLRVECPTGSGNMMNLGQVAGELKRRLTRLFEPDETGRRPSHGDSPCFWNEEDCRGLILFHEYFHGDTGRGLGASHQTGWTALVTRFLEDL